MKTVTVKLVVEEEDKDRAENSVLRCLENELNELPMFSFNVSDSTKKERDFKKRYDEEAKGS